MQRIETKGFIFIKINLTCVLCLTLLYCFGDTAVITPWHIAPLRLIDYDKKDLFFDRIVFFTLDMANYSGDGRANKHVSTGVLIASDRVLTSFNPYRNLTKIGDLLSKILVCYVKTRQVLPPFKTFYTYECDRIVCARPLVPMKDDEILEEQWHGPDKKHSPLHDLMVVRLEDKLDIWQPEREDTYEERYTTENIQKHLELRAGPLLTTLCTAKSKLRKHIQFVSLGLTKGRTNRYFALELAEYEDSENVVLNCDKWLPRNWGHFICIANDDNRFSGFGSGAMLFSERILYGVGSFAIWRGKESILVFTDIRPYLDHIGHTCTEHDLFH